MRRRSRSEGQLVMLSQDEGNEGEGDHSNDDIASSISNNSDSDIDNDEPKQQQVLAPLPEGSATTNNSTGLLHRSQSGGSVTGNEMASEDRSLRARARRGDPTNILASPNNAVIASAGSSTTTTAGSTDESNKGRGARRRSHSEGRRSTPQSPLIASTSLLSSITPAGHARAINGTRRKREGRKKSQAKQRHSNILRKGMHTRFGFLADDAIVF
jgi:hypothetical protein